MAKKKSAKKAAPKKKAGKKTATKKSAKKAAKKSVAASKKAGKKSAAKPIARKKAAPKKVALKKKSPPKKKSAPTITGRIGDMLGAAGEGIASMARFVAPPAVRNSNESTNAPATTATSQPTSDGAGNSPRTM